mgnify:CR=1 FL=1
MRASKARWYAPLLKHPQAATFFIHDVFPTAHFYLEEREIHTNRMIRHVRIDLDGKTILRARSEIDLTKTKPALVRMLRETNTPLAYAIKKFNVRKTRVRCTSRTRAFHFMGDLHGKIWERFYNI